MAATDEKPASASNDILYLLTFALGMLAFWLSGHVRVLLPVFKNPHVALVAGLSLTAGVYGLGMLILSLVVTRRSLKATAAATVTAIILGLLAAQVITRLANGHINSKTDLGLLTFALYMCYGGIYVAALAIGRKIARQHHA